MTCSLAGKELHVFYVRSRNTFVSLCILVDIGSNEIEHTTSCYVTGEIQCLTFFYNKNHGTSS